MEGRVGKGFCFVFVYLWGWMGWWVDCKVRGCEA